MLYRKMCQGRLNTDAHPPPPLYTIESLFRQSPLWVDFLTEGGEWAEAFVTAVSGGAVSVRYRENEVDMVSTEDLHRIKPFHTAIRPDNNRAERCIKRVFRGTPVTFYNFETTKWIDGIVADIKPSHHTIIITPNEPKDHKVKFHVCSNFLQFSVPAPTISDIKESDELKNDKNYSLSSDIFRLRNAPEFRPEFRDKKGAGDFNGEREKKFRDELTEKRGLRIYDIKNDGNCLFRALSHQIYGSERHHGVVRGKCVDFLLAERSFFESFVVGGSDNFESHCAQMRNDAVWGDHLEIQAASELYNRPIEIYEYSTIPMRTYRKAGPNALRISYHSSSHYNSITPQTQTLSSPPGEAEGRALSVAGLRSNKALRSALRISDRADIERQTLGAAIKLSAAERPQNAAEAVDEFFGKAVGHCVEHFGFRSEESAEAYSFVTAGRQILDFDQLIAEMADYVFDKQQR